MATYTSEKVVQTGLTLKLTVTQNGSNCNAKLQMIVATNYSFSASYWSYELRGDASASGSSGYASYSAGTYTLLDKDFTKSGAFSVTGNLYVPWFGWNVNVTVSGGQTKPTFKDLTIYARGEHSIRVEWTASDIIDQVTYKIKPSGGSWTENTVSGHNDDNGYFTIQNLTENKKHYINVKVRRKSDGLESNWSEQSTITTYSAPTQTINDNMDITETSITVNWSCDSEVIKYKYSLDGGDTWSSEYNTSGRSGRYTINGLTPGNDYTIKTSLERETSYWSNTTSKVKSTYNYPYVTSAPNFTIGDTVHIGIYNPLYRTCNVYLIGNDNSQMDSAETETENGVDFRGNYYSSIPNSPAGKYKIRIKCDEISRDITYLGGYYSIIGNEYPTFNSNQWSFTTGYDKNNKVIIKNKSSLSVKVNSSASSNYGASISKYVVKWGNNNPVEITNIANTANFNSGDKDIITVTAVDSRELPKDTVQSIEVIDYEDQKCTITAKRTNGVGEDVKLSLNGSYKQCQLYTNSTTKADNTILSVKYYIKSGNDWGTPYTIPLNQLTIDSGSFSLSNYQIYSDGASAGFTVGTRYNLKIEIEDRYQPKSFEYVITDGKIAVDCYQDSNGDYHRGVNGLANSNYAQTINGDEYVTGLLQYGESGRQDYESAGFSYDKYGNMKHRRSNTGDAWHIDSNDGTAKFIVSPETGVVEANTFDGIATHLKYDQTNEINFNGGKQPSCWFNYRNADSGELEGINNIDYHFSNYGGDTSKSSLHTGNVYLSRAGKFDIGSGGLKGHSSNNDAFLWSNGGWVYIRPKGENTGDAQFIVKNTGQIWSYNQSARVYGATVLYNNTSGSSGNITLSENILNVYDYLVITFRNNDDEYNSTMIYDAYSKKITLMANHNNDSYTWIKTRIYTVWNSVINATSNGTQSRVGNNVATTHSTGDTIYITRVVGYK